jgi:hypothetical protein
MASELIAKSCPESVAEIPTPPADTNSVPPDRTIVPLAVPPVRTLNSAPPLTVAPMSVPPEETNSIPPLSRLVALATPLNSTSSSPLDCTSVLIANPQRSARPQAMPLRRRQWNENPPACNAYRRCSLDSFGSCGRAATGKRFP